jgi:hypothetical protein
MNRWPVALRAHGWRGALAALILLGLLLAFHQVVRSAVREGELRREITALRSAASLRCNELRGRLVRDSCLQSLNASSPDATALRAQNALTIAALQQLNRQRAVAAQ